MPNPPRHLPPPSEILAALERARDGMTSGDLREKLLGSKAGTQCLKALSGTGVPASARALQAAAYHWWERQEIFIEPPRPGKNALRLWHPRRIPAAWRPAPTPDSPPPAGSSQPSLNANSTAGEQKLMVDITQLLVSTWKRSPHDMAKRTLRSILHNLGVQRIEEAGQQVPFQPQDHECEEPVDPGQPVEVIEPGWILRHCPGDYLLAKATVKKLSLPLSS